MRQGAKQSRSFVMASSLATLLAIASPATMAQAAEAVFSEPALVTLFNSVQYDMKSAITGRDYRIFISAPADAGPDKAYPVLYILDANRDFQTAANYARGIIVGIGYPLQDMREFGPRRQLDLTPTVDVSRSVPTGDSVKFLSMLEEEVRPFVEARYNLVADDQSLYGHSLGGLTVLGHTFRHPEAFNTFMIGSPSIWWDNSVVLADEAAFSARLKTGELNLRVLLMSAGDEQNCTAALSAAAQADCQQNRMVDNVTDLAARLQTLNPDKLQITRAVFEGESHNSSVRASLGRALYFVMPE